MMKDLRSVLQEVVRNVLGKPFIGGDCAHGVNCPRSRAIDDVEKVVNRPVWLQVVVSEPLVVVVRVKVVQVGSHEH